MHLELLYCPYGMKNGFSNSFAPNVSMTSLEKVFKSGAEKEAAQNGGEINRRKDVTVRGVLSVTVISADHLAPTGVKADPYVVVTMKKTETKNKTRVSFLLFS